MLVELAGRHMANYAAAHQAINGWIPRGAREHAVSRARYPARQPLQVIQRAVEH